MTILMICILVLAAIGFHRVTSPDGWRAERARRLRLTRYWPEQYTEEYMTRAYGPDWTSKKSCTSERMPLDWYDVKAAVESYGPVTVALIISLWCLVNEGRK